MTEEEIQALINARLIQVFTQVATEARARDSGSGIQLDSAMIYLAGIADLVVVSLST